MTSYAAPPELVALIKKHEGFRSRVYQDINGRWTVGYGRNVSDVGVSVPEAEYLLTNDIEIAAHQAAGVVGDAVFSALNPARQAAIVDICFNVGAQRLSLFVKFLAAIRDSNWKAAHDELLNSKWASQVGGRSVTVAAMVLTGEWPAGIL